MTVGVLFDLTPRELSAFVAWARGGDGPVMLESEQQEYRFLGKGETWMIRAPADADEARRVKYRIMTRALRALGTGVVKVRQIGGWFHVTRKAVK